jgi:hypothetical protein
MRIWARRNHVGWIQLWTRRDAYESGEASEHFFNGRIDPLWQATILDDGPKAGLERGELVEIEDPGYFPPEDESAVE